VAQALLRVRTRPRTLVLNQIQSELRDLFHMHLHLVADRPHHFQRRLVLLNPQNPRFIIHVKSAPRNPFEHLFQVLVVKPVEPNGYLIDGEYLESDELLVLALNADTSETADLRAYLLGEAVSAFDLGLLLLLLHAAVPAGTEVELLGTED